MDPYSPHFDINTDVSFATRAWKAKLISDVNMMVLIIPTEHGVYLQ